MIRFYNGFVLSMNGGTGVTCDEVWVEGDSIVYVGPEKTDMPKFEREIDLKGDVLMPGFKNAHAHSAMTFLRSYAEDMPLHEWLFSRVLPLEEKLTPEAVYAFTRLAILEYLTSGITASFDMYFYTDDYISASLDCGFRTVLCESLSAQPRNWDRVYDRYERYNNTDPLISYIMGFHAEYTASEEMLRYAAEAARKLRVPVYSHNSETASEVKECIERNGLTPTAYFESFGMFEYGGGGFHCNYMTDEDLEIFKKHDMWVVTNPASNLKLASGIAPITTMLQKGINLAIGTDGSASNNALDMFREMYLVSVLQKYSCGDASACPADKVLEMATVGGARAIGLADCDVIAEGKKADLIVIDMSRPNMQPVHSIPKNIVYSGSKENVRLTMIGGRVLYENGEFFVGESPERIYAEAEKYTRAITEA